MVTREPTKEMFETWKAIWTEYKDKLQPNRKSGAEVLAYLQSRYVLTEIYDKNALDTITLNVTENERLSEKLPRGVLPESRAFYLENEGDGEKFYLPENIDHIELWGGEITKIFVGVDLSSGFYHVEGSAMLWDELCAFQGLDGQDLKNYVIVGQYIQCLKRFDKLEDTEAGNLV